MSETEPEGLPTHGMMLAMVHNEQGQTTSVQSIFTFSDS